MEITTPLAIGNEEASLLDMHSVLNVLNVVQYELMRLEELCGDDVGIDELSTQLIDTASILRDPEAAIQRVKGTDQLISAVRDKLDELSATDCGNAELFASIENNLEGIFAILLVRAREIVSRWDEPKAWKSHSASQLKRNFQEVFHAIETNSHGAYRIVSNVAQHEEGDYLLVFEIDSVAGDQIMMPPVFQDVMRDLMANARKYTAPGGKITAGFYQGDDMLRFIVEDSGVGIPTEEIENVVQFGARGTNVQNRPTRGGGFGLTKAYYVTKSFGGRMFIDSPVLDGKGTRIKIELPIPENYR